MKINTCILVLMAACISGCHTQRHTSPASPVILNNVDSIRTEYIETVVIDTLIIKVPVPIESAKQSSNDSTSHVETSLAESDAWINPDGSLGHSIRNKHTNLRTQALVPRTTIGNNREAVSIKEIPVPAPYPVEIERQFTKAEQFKLAAFWYLIGAVVVSISFVFRKSLFTILRKIIRL